MDYKQGVKYKLTGYKVVGFEETTPREEIAEWKNGYWCIWGYSKQIKNFVILGVEECML